MASLFRNFWAAPRRSPSAASAVLRAARCPPVMCSPWASPMIVSHSAFRVPPSRRSVTIGNSPSPKDRTALPIFSPVAISMSCCPRTTKCISTPIAPACDSSAPSPTGHAPTAAKQGCTRRTSTTTPTRWARSTSPETPRFCWVPTAPAWADSSAPSRWCPRTAGNWASCVRATPCDSSGSRLPAAPRCARSVSIGAGTGHRCFQRGATATTACWPTARPVTTHPR
ncbi:Uncharacterised protein [Mycobacteroides abscessus subsp. massiliense]|nr:Uncharacterised protein [Mycobacteroides abscessus subsp. massiliense]